MHKQKIALQAVNYCYKNYCFKLVLFDKSYLLSIEYLTFLVLSCILLLRAKTKQKQRHKSARAQKASKSMKVNKVLSIRKRAIKNKVTCDEQTQKEVKKVLNEALLMSDTETIKLNIVKALYIINQSRRLFI